MNWLLHVQQGDQDGTLVPLPDQELVQVGRGRGCDIRIPGMRVSRRHFQLRRQQDRWILEDLGSRNGTSVNGRKVARIELGVADTIRIGDTYLCLVRQSVDETSTAGIGGDDASGPIAPGKAKVSGGADRRERQKPLLGRRYELGEMFHRGATGTFHKARDTHRGRTVCIKILSRQLAQDAADLKRFVRGIQTAAKLRHPNIVRLYHAGQTDQRSWWLAMEYVDGPSARSLANQIGVGKMLLPERVIAIGRDVASALQAAYQRDIMHRSVKPDNILLTKGGVAKLSNFTLARGVVLTTLQQITTTNETVGDLAYMAPECVEPGASVDCRVDIYGLGACLYTLLTGRPPFTGRGKVDLLEKIRFEEPAAPSKYNLSVAAPLEGLVMKCLQKQPTDRYPTPQALLDDLDRVARFRR